ncbi:MAG: murein biosynthesis integral membrane protein MurJ [Phycisphaerales bacterium]
MPAPPANAEGANAMTLGGGVRSTVVMTLLSRVAGLIREVLIARAFGPSMVGSAFTFAFAVPNMFRRLLGEGALAAAFVPEYAQLIKHQPTAGHLLASRTLRKLAILTGVLALGAAALLIAGLWLIPESPSRTLTMRLLAVVIFFMPPVCCAAILAAMLSVHGRFAAAASGPVVLNGFLVAVGIYYWLRHEQAGEATAFVLAGATVLSGITQCVTFVVLLRPHARWLRLNEVEPPVAEAATTAARRILTRLLAVVVGVGTLQLNTLIDQLIAMWPNLVGPTILGRAYPLEESSNIILANAQRRYQFPLGVFGIAVASAVFPLLSLSADEPARFGETLRRGVRLSLFLGIPATIGLMVVAYDLAFVLYGGAPGHGYGPEDVARVAWVLAGYAPGVWAFSLNHVLTRAFYARGDTRTPMRVGVVMVAVNLALNLSLIWPLKEAGLAVATTVSAIVQSAVLGHILQRRAGVAWVDRVVAGAALRVLIAAVVMGALCGACVWLWTITPPAENAAAAATGMWWRHLARLGTTCAIGMLVFAALSLTLRMAEVGWLLRPRAALGTEAGR